MPAIRLWKTLSVGVVAAASLTYSQAASAKTLGFVLTKWHHAGEYSPQAKVECPGGLTPGLRENFRAAFKTKEAQQAQIDKFAGIEMRARGPNGESETYSPEMIEDPLPFHEAQGKTSRGFNLDGTADGHATNLTCKHKKLASPDGGDSIDNQMYRAMGCIQGMRPDGVSDGLANSELLSRIFNRWVIEVAGVDDEMNDDQVDVTIGHGLDKLAQDSSGKFVPGLTQRLDEDMPGYLFHAAGKIVNGVLVTDPIPNFELGLEFGPNEHSVLPFLSARLQVKLGADNTTGVIGGYQDVDRYYRNWAKSTGHHSIIANASAPSFYRALYRNADGYKDPNTGECTAISGAYDIELTRAFILRSSAAPANDGAKNEGVSAARTETVPVTVKNEARPPNITIQTTDDGVVYADKNGMTIYTAAFDQRRNESKCTNAVRTHGLSVGGDAFPFPNQDHRPTCLSQHPIVAADGGSPVGAWTIINRPDGLKQWAYDGKPLYTSIKDVHPGEANAVLDLSGGGKNGDPAFQPLRVTPILPPEVRIEPVGDARVLVSSRDRRTLYSWANDPRGQSKCDNDCLLTWQPLIASEIAKDIGGWTVIKRSDSTRQWAFNGKPLYTYKDDVFPGDYNGNRFAGWDVMLANPLPAVPDVVKVANTLVGPRYVTRDGMTLYRLSCVEQGGLTACDTPETRSLWWVAPCGGSEAKCADIYRPLFADENAKPVGTLWSIVTIREPWSPIRSAEGEQGRKVWAFRGKPVFTYKYDRPGLIEGEDFGILVHMKWTSIEADGHDINASKKPTETRSAAR